MFSTRRNERCNFLSIPSCCSKLAIVRPGAAFQEQDRPTSTFKWAPSGSKQFLVNVTKCQARSPTGLNRNTFESNNSYSTTIPNWNCNRVLQIQLSSSIVLSCYIKMANFKHTVLATRHTANCTPMTIWMQSVGLQGAKLLQLTIVRELHLNTMGITLPPNSKGIGIVWKCRLIRGKNQTQCPERWQKVLLDWLCRRVFKFLDEYGVGSRNCSSERIRRQRYMQMAYLLEMNSEQLA